MHRITDEECRFYVEKGAEELVEKVLTASPLNTTLLRELYTFLNENKDTDSIKAFNYKFVTKLLVEYNATMSSKDRKIYDILVLLERVYDINMSPLFPIVWGEKSKEHYEELETLGTSLHQISTTKVMEYIDEARMWKTMKNCTRKHIDDIYDIRFIFQLVSNIEHVGTEVDCRLMIEKNFLSVMFGATSHSCIEIRNLAYHSLQKFLNLLLKVPETVVESTFPERPLFVYLLKLFKQSLDEVATKTSHIISHFFARVSKLMLHPEDAVYTSIMSFLCLKPKICLTTVPELYKLLLSTSLEKYKLEREWVLRYLTEAIIEPADYNAFQNQSGIKLIQGLFGSILCDQKARKYILQILKNCVSMPTSGNDLFRRQNLHSWIVMVIDLPQLTRWEQIFLAEIFVVMVEKVKTNVMNEFDGRQHRMQAMITGAPICAMLKKLVSRESKAKTRLRAISDLIDNEWVPVKVAKD